MIEQTHLTATSQWNLVKSRDAFQPTTYLCFILTWRQRFLVDLHISRAVHLIQSIPTIISMFLKCGLDSLKMVIQQLTDEVRISLWTSCYVQEFQLNSCCDVEKCHVTGAVYCKAGTIITWLLITFTPGSLISGHMLLLRRRIEKYMEHNELCKENMQRNRSDNHVIPVYCFFV